MVLLVVVLVLVGAGGVVVFVAPLAVDRKERRITITIMRGCLYRPMIPVEVVVVVVVVVLVVTVVDPGLCDHQGQWVDGGGG